MREGSSNAAFLFMRVMMDKVIDFYIPDQKYMKYLSQFDAKVPFADYQEQGRQEKFQCGIVLRVNNHDYYAPVSHFNKSQPSNFIIKNERGEAVASIRFSFMVPVPVELVRRKEIAKELSLTHRHFLNWELNYCRTNAKAIFSTAKFVYDAFTNVNHEMHSLMVKNCCDFKLLEAKSVEFIRDYGIEVGTPKNQPETAVSKEHSPKPMSAQFTEAAAEAAKHNAALYRSQNRKSSLER
jgi:protein AbiQ